MGYLLSCGGLNSSLVNPEALQSLWTLIFVEVNLHEKIHQGFRHLQSQSICSVVVLWRFEGVWAKKHREDEPESGMAAPYQLIDLVRALLVP